MKKRTYFDVFDGPGWPEPSQLAPFFHAPPGQEWSYLGRNDGWALTATGVDGTDHLERGKGRIDIDLTMWGNPKHGVLLMYSKWGGGHKETFNSKGNLARLREWVRTKHGDPMPIGLFIPFKAAWPAVKEFIETDGQLPKSIEWIADRDLPPGTFPDP